MYVITKCTLGYIIIWNLFSRALKWNYTTKFTTLHKTAHEILHEVHNVLHNKMYWKIEFSLRFGFLKQVKNKVYIQNWIQTISREIPLTW